MICKGIRLEHWLALSCLAAGPGARAHEWAVQAPAGWEPTPVSSEQEFAPGPMPDRVVLTWPGDPATTQAVSWRTDASAPVAVAELAVAGDLGPKMEAKRHLGRTAEFETSEGIVHQHRVGFRSLRPSTLYAYRVGDGANWTEWFHFRTASQNPEPFTFVYMGDAQNDIKTHWSRVYREAFREAPRAAFFLHAGDLVNNGDHDGQWGEWFHAGAWVNATIPVVATPGNHEYKTRDDQGLTPYWAPQFAFPENGPDGLTSSVYTIDYQGARIVSLNSNERQSEQTPWLRDVLENNPCRWTIVTFHHPLFSPATDRDNKALRERWKPVLDQYRVDVVLTGHDHTYARSGVPDPTTLVGTENVSKGYNQVYDPDIGTVCVVSVSGPKMYKIHDNSWARVTAENTQLFQIITIDGDELRYEARTAVNRLYDAFTLRKQPGGPNLLIETMAGP